MSCEKPKLPYEPPRIKEYRLKVEPIIEQNPTVDFSDIERVKAKRFITEEQREKAEEDLRARLSKIEREYPSASGDLLNEYIDI